MGIICKLPVDRPVIIRQGFNSGLSHRIIEDEDGLVDDSYSLDFVLKEGSNVYAARPGIVENVHDESDFSYFPEHGEQIDPCLLRKALESINYVIIEHADGTNALYAHLQRNGSLVSPGEEVSTGQEIALSGNTGLSSEPHLHFSIFVRDVDDFRRKTVPLSFEKYDGSLEDRGHQY